MVAENRAATMLEIRAMGIKSDVVKARENNTGECKSNVKVRCYSTDFTSEIRGEPGTAVVGLEIFVDLR